LGEVVDGVVDWLFWPLYEVVDGRYGLTYLPPAVRPVTDWLALQGRFAHLLRPENAAVVAEIQAQVEADWLALLEQCGGRTVAGSGRS
jgi:pyruvate ferredoxin oxidoreductase beta subunit